MFSKMLQNCFLPPQKKKKSYRKCMSIWPVSTFYSFGMRCDVASEDITEAYKLQEMALPLGPEILIQKL